MAVTSFFREPETFEALKEKVFPELVKNRSPDESIRVWVPGCSTGEEVYSFAIAIQEFLEENAHTDIRVQIFGTDANEKNIEKARQGTYPKSIEDKCLSKSPETILHVLTMDIAELQNPSVTCVYLQNKT